MASTILAPGTLGYHHYDLYPTPGGRGDPAKARALLAEAGYPKGLTLGFATFGSGRLAAGRKPIEASLARAGIRLKVTTNKEVGPHFEALRNPAKRLEHQLAQGGWILDYLGDNARQTIVPQYDSRLGFWDNFSEYNNPEVNRLIDRALAEPDQARRAVMWAEIDRRIMRDAPWARCSGSGPRSTGPPGSTAGCTTPGRPRPTSPPCGWTPRAPDRGLSPGRPGPAAEATAVSSYQERACSGLELWSESVDEPLA